MLDSRHERGLRVGTVLPGAFFRRIPTAYCAIMVLHWRVEGAAEAEGPPTLNPEMARFATPCTACSTPVLLVNTCPGCGRRVSRGSRDESVSGVSAGAKWCYSLPAAMAEPALTSCSLTFPSIPAANFATTTRATQATAAPASTAPSAPSASGLAGGARGRRLACERGPGASYQGWQRQGVIAITSRNCKCCGCMHGLRCDGGR